MLVPTAVSCCPSAARRANRDLRDHHPNRLPTSAQLCDDVAATVAALQAEGIEVARPISDQNWGLLTAITVPGGVELDLYQPRHPTATQPS